MSKSQFLLLTGILSLLASACRTGGVSPVYDVVVVGGGPAGAEHIRKATLDLFSLSHTCSGTQANHSRRMRLGNSSSGYMRN